MFIKRNYSLRDMLKWTRKETYKFILIALIPVVLYSVLNQKWLHLPWLPIALIGTAVAFLVSFKNNASYGRLWEARKIWGGIVNTSRSFAVMVNAYVTNENAPDVSDEELQQIKETLIKRHVAWMAAHRYTLRQHKLWEINTNNLPAEEHREFAEFYKIPEWIVPQEEALAPYLSKEELEEIKGKRSAASQLLSFQSEHLRALKERGLIWDFSHLEIEKLIVEMFTLQGKNERIKNFPYPRQFATLNLFFVWIFVFLLPFGIMNEFDKIGMELLENPHQFELPFLEKSYLFLARHFVWLSVPFSILVSWIFHTMEKIGTVSENPFEGTPNDIPITSMSRAIEIDIFQIIGIKDIPETIKPHYNVQM